MAEPWLTETTPLDTSDIPTYTYRSYQPDSYRSPRLARTSFRRSQRPTFWAWLAGLRGKEPGLRVEGIQPLPPESDPHSVLEGMSVIRYQVTTSEEMDGQGAPAVDFWGGQPPLVEGPGPRFRPRMPAPSGRSLLIGFGAAAAACSFAVALGLRTEHAAKPQMSRYPAAAALIAAQGLEAKRAELQAGTPAERPADIRKYKVHVVQAGETFTSIGARYTLTGRSVRLANGYPLGFQLRAGMKLQLPPSNGVYHRVTSGETVGALCMRYGVKMAKIQHFNPTLSLHRLSLGQRIFIPGAQELKLANASKNNGKPEADAKEHKKDKDRTGHGRHRRMLASRGLIGAFGARVGHIAWPSAGTMSSPFGARGGSFHSGIDICNNVGTPIHAVRDGTVVAAGWNGAYGYAVDVAHGGGVVTRYGHCSRLMVHCGQSVSAGEVIALIGSTGRSTGPHVHFEVRVFDRPVDPNAF